MLPPDPEPNPKGRPRVGSCAFLECTEDATKDRRIIQVAVPHGPRIMIRVCDLHAQALLEGGTILVEYRQG